ncbi:NAD-dependent epimerase/dehydratase family protein [Aerosakkonemataceae cyanobacterium BLCC-F50]|uniref:NAD-dependent epimerase/dehydratase family protein n=1 Tax=Floridaenema flaviceps BLCC-F50 TaxID=3153642 RepID=A0ABV4XXJ3_9CYAN
MIGDSLAGETNNPDKQENLELNSPEISVAESNDSKASEAITSDASLESLVTEEIQETGESISPNIQVVESEAIEIQSAPELAFSATSETGEIQETGESNSPEIPVVESELIEIQQAPDLTFSATSETGEIQETGESSSPEIPVVESEAIEIQSAPDLADSETDETGEIQETGESNSPEIQPAEFEIREIQEKPELKVAQTAKVAEAINSSVGSPLPLTSETAPTKPNKDCLRILITGASGCIGQYIAETLIKETEHELFLLVRDPKKLIIDCNYRSGVNIVQGDMKYISRLAKMLKTMDCAILTAAAWGGQQEALDVNVFKTLQLLNYLDPKVCQQVIYFSTASLLDKHNHLLKEARELGTEYIRSKYEGLTRISKLPIADRVTTLFPTLVLGGDAKHPYSHISSGLPGLKKWINYIRFFKADGSFHFIHAQDIAQVVLYLVKNPPSREQKNWFVLGNQPTTVNQAVEEACEYLRKPIFFRLNLSPWLADILIGLFRIQMAAWDRFCLEYRHFTYTNAINPATFGLPVYCSTIKDVLKTSGIGEPRKIAPNSMNYNSSKTVENRLKDYRQAFEDKEQ